jgi:hypothetical protein
VSFESAVSFLDSSDLLFAIFWVLLLLGAFVVSFPESPNSEAVKSRQNR